MSLAGGGCASLIGLEAGEEGDPSLGAGGSSGQTSAGEGGDAVSCEPGKEEPCYDGPVTTLGVGACQGGVRTCDADGRGFSACIGQVLPAADTCDPTKPIDGNCNGYSCSETHWAKAFGDSAAQYGTRVATDADGNVVMVGSFFGVADFDGGAITSAGETDVFVAKFKPDGGHIWSKGFGNQSAQVANSVAVDAAGNVIVVGSFDGSIDFGGGAMTTAGGNDVFIAKLSPSGAFLWQKQLGDIDNQQGRSVAVDAAGNVVVCGSFRGKMDFDGGSVASVGDYDAFVASFGPDGDVRWKIRFGDTEAQKCEAVSVSPDGDVFFTGSFKGSMIVGGQTLTSQADLNSYVVKLDKDGVAAWSLALAGPSTQYSESLAAGADGSVVVTGYTTGSLSVGDNTLSNAGASDIFAVKLEADGSYAWGDTFGDAGDQLANGVAVDAAGNVFIVGQFGGNINFGGPPLSAQGTDTDDMFVAKLDGKQGTHIWSRSLGDATNQYAVSAAVSPDGALFVTGYVEGSVNLGGSTMKTHGGLDAFLARFEP